MRLPVSDDPRAEAEENPMKSAREILDRENISTEERSVESILQEFTELANLLRPRWELLCSYRMWENTGRKGDEPVFWDDDSKAERSAKYALAPCQLINKCLSAAVELTLVAYSPEKLKSVMSALFNQAEENVNLLRNTAIYGEEAMEQEALHLIFRIAEDYPDLHLDMVRSKAREREISITPLSLLETLVVHLPRSLKQQHPEVYTDLPFLYFLNYSELVVAELQLLRVPAILQNSAATYHFSSTSELLKNNPILRAASKLAAQSPLIEQFISSFPELFGYRNLADKTFTFVGAGFPLTGIILHIETGASINLIDYDKDAVKTAKKFLAITEKLGVTRPGAFKVIMADARDVVYLPTRRLPGTIRRHDGANCPPYCPTNPKLSGKQIVPTDILDLASALSAEDTAQVIRENAALVPTIRKRNVRGISEVLYERFTLREGESNFRLAGEVTPPQKVVSGATPAHLVTGLTATRNINSCQLYVNTCNFGSKFKFLENIFSFSGYEQLKENVEEGESRGYWDNRVREFYKVNEITNKISDFEL
ncbi:hypothetical protein ACHWQZ_G011824 [Mnemiopsis leidyi]